MEHSCQDCQATFNEEGQNGPHIAPAVQCPQCHSYRTQPSGIPPEANDMTQTAPGNDMPTSTQDDMSGNPLQEGSLGGWQNRDKRDEVFSSHITATLESPEFETTQIIAPPDLYRHGLESEQTHRATVQLPNGITDNLHAALGNLQAWVENPYENGQLRPYGNKYWKAIRPRFMKPGSLQIGVADPTMAEIINHVAQTDDLTPLHEYRGRASHIRIAGPLLLGLGEGAAAALPEIATGAEGLLGLGGGAADAAGTAAGLADGAGASAAAGADAGGAGSGGIGGVMNKVMNNPLVKGLGYANKLQKGIGFADDLLGGGGAMAGGGSPDGNLHDESFYAHVTASDEDDAHPNSHDEIPQNEGGDAKQQDDGNQHEWQRDISVNGTGGTDQSPSFDPAGPGMQRFKMLLPLLMDFINSGQDGSQDPLVQALHQTLDGEIPGYLDHGNDEDAHKLITILSPGGKPETKTETAEPEKDDETHTDEDSGGKHESRTASITLGAADGGDFLAAVDVTAPALNGLRTANPHEFGVDFSPQSADEAFLNSELWPSNNARKPEVCPYCGAGGSIALGMCNACGREVYDTPQNHEMARAPAAHIAAAQMTDEQQAVVQQYIMDHGQEMGLQGPALNDALLSVIQEPWKWMTILADIQGKQAPPEAPQEAAGLNTGPPAPAQEQAPPGATMPMPGMTASPQMQAAVNKYAADSVAGRCPNCKSHTTEIIDEKGESRCHSCGKFFKTPGKTPVTAGWEMDQDRAPTDGEPLHGAEDEISQAHAWTDEAGSPLKVGQEYEMYSQKYDIPDQVRIEAVKPTTLVLTYVNSDFGSHSSELSKKEANMEGTTFRAAQGEAGLDDAGSFEQNNDDNSGFEGSPETADLSAPAGQVRANIISSGVNEESDSRAWLKEAGANFTAMEQRALIDERGSARNANRLDLSNTHYVQDADEDQFLFGV